jgi:hypothetical protein
MSAATTNSGSSLDTQSDSKGDSASDAKAPVPSGAKAAASSDTKVADASDAKATDASGAKAPDASGADPSGAQGFYKKIWLGFNKITGTAGGKASGILLMFIIAFQAGVLVLILFLCSQNLIYLTKAKHMVNIPTNIKKAPYAKVEGGPTGMFYRYGAPYSFKHNPTVIPWVPCNYPRLRTLFGIKKWIGGTCIHSWLYGRKLLKAVLEGLSGLPNSVKIFLALPIMSGMAGLSGLVSLVFTIVSSFQSSVIWSILGIILTLFPILLFLLAFFQHMALMYYLFISPLTTAAGRQHLAESIHKHKTLLTLVYVGILILLSPIFLGKWWTLGMVAGILFFGFR